MDGSEKGGKELVEVGKSGIFLSVGKRERSGKEGKEWEEVERSGKWKGVE